jgi:hypothetical protein
MRILGGDKSDNVKALFFILMIVLWFTFISVLTIYAFVRGFFLIQAIQFQRANSNNSQGFALKEVKMSTPTPLSVKAVKPIVDKEATASLVKNDVNKEVNSEAGQFVV